MHPDRTIAVAQLCEQLLHSEVRLTRVMHTSGDQEQVDHFYAAAMANGAFDNGAPGLRLHYHPNYYGAFVIDPDGHNVEAVCHEPR